MMAVYEAFRLGPKIVHSFTGHPEMSREIVEETLLILQENLLDLFLELGRPVLRWMFSVPDLLQQTMIRPFAIGK